MADLRRIIKEQESFTDSIELPWYTIIFPLIVYEVLSIVVSQVSRSQEIIMISGNVLPVATFSGVIAAFANIFIILMVLMYKKLGFIVSVAMLLIQMPALISGIIASHYLASIPGLFTNITTVLTITIIYISQRRLERERKRLRNLFEQTATALVNAIDAKDKYTHGHSARVAEYSRKLAEMSGKSEKECDEVYYAALLHDVGKIGIPVSIINKMGKLTSQEYEVIKQHPTLGAQILENISEYPFLSVGAHYHHERYDGKGYPDGKRGKEIPDIARIITVADAYDAMTSVRSYRDPIPQQKVREEIIVCAGTQFDPEYARLMLRMVDADHSYDMKEEKEPKEPKTVKIDDELVIGEYRSFVKEGIYITPHMTNIRMLVSSDDEATGIAPEVSMILFDALDGKYHSDEKEIKDLLYVEYGEITLDGQTTIREARGMQTEISEEGSELIERNGEYVIEAVRVKDHAQIKILGKNQEAKIIVAMPDSTRYLYIGLTGRNCRISDLKVVTSTKDTPADFIPRIAEKISFVNGPDGDVPNLQVDGDRTEFSSGLVVEKGFKLRFHSMSLPTARLVWHCPFLLVFSSDDGRVEGANYRLYSMIKLNGECSAESEFSTVTSTIKTKKEFPGWDGWKQTNKDGLDYEVFVERDESRITIKTENLGISIECTTTVTDSPEKVFVALTGDQVALTDIRIVHSVVR